jgi:phosphoserine aminotransferase
MSSDILSRPVDVAKYNCIYGGAQKNLAQSGLSFVIVKESALGKVGRGIPSILDYRVHIANGSLFNTPPTLPIYTALCNLRWVKEQGGVKEMERRARERALLLYDEIDRNPLFCGTAAEDDRSYMNIDFVMAPGYEELEDAFAAFAAGRGVVAIKGHRTVGGFRASCYNAMPLEGVQALAACMRDFKKMYPDVNFVIRQGDYNDTQNGIMDGTIDFGFTIIGASPQLENVPLYSDDMMAILPLDHPLANEKSVTFAQLANQPFILLYEGEYINILNAFSSEGVAPDVQYKVYDDYSIISMVKKGLGISVLYKTVLKDVSFDLSVVPIEGSHSRTIALVYKNWDTLPKAAQLFARHVIDHAKEILDRIEL